MCLGGEKDIQLACDLFYLIDVQQDVLQLTFCLHKSADNRQTIIGQDMFLLVTYGWWLKSQTTAWDV